MSLMLMSRPSSSHSSNESIRYDQCGITSAGQGRVYETRAQRRKETYWSKLIVNWNDNLLYC
jgi:hypothetical protein